MVLERLEDCARCGSCKARCPVYEMTLNEAHSPRGRLMLLRGLVEGRLKAGPGLVERMNSCALCGLCDTSCPVGIRPTELIYKGRHLLRKADRKRILLRMAAKAGLRRPALGMKAARLLGGFPALMPVKLPVPERPLRDDTQVIKPAVKSPRGRVAVFAGCSTNYLMPSAGESLITMLASIGYEVVLPRGEVCCGVPLRSLGFEEEAERFARKNLEIFGRLNAEAVVSPCPTCVLAIKEQYGALIGGAVENAVDAVSFLINKLEVGKSSPKGRLLWHEPCHSRLSPGFDNPAFFDALGIERAEPGCCGFGLNLTDRALASEFLRKRVEAYRRADVVVTSCPACMIQIERGGIGAMHIVELMEEALFAKGAKGALDA
jgi:glycolate oxidase iron-sulfur subunit